MVCIVAFAMSHGGIGAIGVFLKILARGGKPFLSAFGLGFLTVFPVTYIEGNDSAIWPHVLLFGLVAASIALSLYAVFKMWRAVLSSVTSPKRWTRAVLGLSAVLFCAAVFMILAHLRGTAWS